MRPEKQARIAKVTRDVLIPLAERLGVQALKTELEDLVFAILHPEEYARDPGADRRQHAAGADPLARDRRGRPHGAARRRHRRRGRHPAAALRLRAPRCSSSAAANCGGSDFGRLLVLVGEDADCYAVLGELHTCFTPVISEFKDFIAAPKFNLYQSLHTAVADARRPDRRSPGPHPPDAPGRRGRRHRARQPLRRQPAGRTPDGGRAASAVDPTRPGWLVPAAGLAARRRPTRTPSGPRCATTSPRTARSPSSPPTAAPSGCPRAPAAWTPPTRCTARARTPASAPGSTAGSPRWAPRCATATPLQLLMARPPPPAPHPTGWTTPAPPPPGSRSPAGSPRTRAPAADDEPAAAPPGPPGAGAASPAAEPVAVADLPDAAVRLARCCTPVPPDAVTGFVIRGGTVTVHRDECAEVARMTAAGPRRPCRCAGATSSAPAATGSPCVAEALGRPRLLADLTEAIAARGRRHRLRHRRTAAGAPGPPHLHRRTARTPPALPALMRAMRGVPGVYDVYRAQRPARRGPRLTAGDPPENPGDPPGPRRRDHRGTQRGRPGASGGNPAGPRAALFRRSDAWAESIARGGPTARSRPST